MKKSLLIILVIIMFIFTGLSDAGIVTTTYEFIPVQSSVLRTGGLTGIPKEYSIEGQFQITVDFDTGVASFKNVDATLSNGESLNILFNFTGLNGTVISDTVINFEGHTLDYPFDVQVQVTLRKPQEWYYLSGGFVENVPDGFTYDLDAVAVVIPEPATLLIMGLGGILVFRHRRS